MMNRCAFRETTVIINIKYKQRSKYLEMKVQLEMKICTFIQMKRIAYFDFSYNKIIIQII